MAKSKTKKDACYHKVKSRYTKWPSAYASGALVKCRKVGAKNWGNKSRQKKANGASCNSVSLLECWWIIQGMTVMVEADAGTDVIMMHMAADDIGYQDFSKFGGLPSTVEYGSTTGDVLFTTTGLGAAGDTYNIVMRMKKHYA